MRLTFDARLLAPLLSLAVVVAVPREAAAQRPTSETMQTLKQDPKMLLEVVHDYLAMVSEMGAAVKDPLRTQIIVQHDIKEIYEKLGKPEEAVKELRQALDLTKDPDARIAMRLALADVLKTSGKQAEALEELRAILAENRARMERKK